MKTLIILATLFASSLAAVPLPLPKTGTPELECLAADKAIMVARAFAEPRLPKCGNTTEAVDAGIAAFKHKIGCGLPPPEPEAPPADERCSKAECEQLDQTIKDGEPVLRAEFLVLPAKYGEGVKEAVRVCKKKLGCEEDPEVTV